MRAGVESERTGEVVLIVPPFADLYRPYLAAHILQACARREGFTVSVLYANLLFVKLSGERLYDQIAYSLRPWKMGERMFSRAAFGLPPLGRGLDSVRKQMGERRAEVMMDDLLDLESKVPAFCQSIASGVAAARPVAAGASTTFEQTAASVALLAALKTARPEIVTMIGGANCEGEMAEGVGSLSPCIDYIFSGECESAFPDFLKQLAVGRKPLERICIGTPCENLDSIPEIDFDDYLSQLPSAIPEWKDRHLWLSYETSRGCWWGQKQHCTFCGLNKDTMAFREKSPERAIRELKNLTAKTAIYRVAMADNIMPHSYFRTLLPALGRELPGVSLFYEQKSNLSLDQSYLLKHAGMDLIQPGIEALDSAFLKAMKKGVQARQNIALLRYARSAQIWLNWNLLWDFPGEEAEWYERTLQLIPLLSHLNPPSGIHRLVLDRFSPYFRDAARYGISNVRPLEAYSEVFPETARIRELSYSFQGDYESEYRRPNSTLRERLESAVAAWRHRWDDPDVAAPALETIRLDDETYLLLDTRELPGTEAFRILTREEAWATLAGGPVGKQPLSEWAIRQKLAVHLDGWLVPLAVSDYETIRQFEQAASTPHISGLVGDNLPVLQMNA